VLGIKIKRINKINYYWVILTAFFIVRIIIVTKQPIYFDEFDSSYYFEFKIFNAFRLPIITLLFSVLKTNGNIVIFHALVSSLSWLFFLIYTKDIFKNKFIRLFYQIVILLFSFSQIVLLRDSYILSESLTLSSSLVLIACTLNFNKNKFFHHYMFLFFLVIFSGVKSTNSIIGLLIIFSYLIFLFFVMTRDSKLHKIYLISILSTLVIGSFAHSSVSSEITAKLNTSAIINYRIWGNDDWKSFLLEKNYPPELRTIWRDRRQYNLGETPDQGVINEKIFQKWWDRDGETFLIDFMLNNPGYTIFGPIFLPILNSKTDYSYTLLHGWAQDPRANREILRFDLPTNVLWPEERIYSYIFVFVVLCTFSFYFLFLTVMNQYQQNIGERIALILTFVFFWSYFSWWFGSKPGDDILRHQEMPSVTLRLIFLISLFQILDYFTQYLKSHFCKD